MRLFQRNLFTDASNQEASLAVLACSPRLRGDQVLLLMVVRYLLVPVPQFFASLRKAAGGRLRLTRASKGKGKGPSSLAMSPSGSLWAGHCANRQVFASLGSSKGDRRCTSFCWRSACRGTAPAAIVCKGPTCSAPLLAWQENHGTPDLAFYSAEAVCIDDRGQLCAWCDVGMIRQSPGLSMEVVLPRCQAPALGERASHATQSISGHTRCRTARNSLAVAGNTWYLALHHEHRIVRVQPAAGADAEIVAGLAGCGDGPGQLRWPSAVAVRDDGSLLVLDQNRHKEGRLLQVTPAGVESVLLEGLDSPEGLAVHGNRVFFSESGRRQIHSLRVEACGV